MIELRAARSTDAGKVGAILSDFANVTDWMPQLHSRAEDIAHAGEMISREWVTVAERDGDIVGFSACDKDDLDALYVTGAARRQGVGTALLRRLQELRPSLHLWTFQANVPAQKFYVRHGFSETQRTDGSGNDERLPDIRYVWHRKGR